MRVSGAHLPVPSVACGCHLSCRLSGWLSGRPENGVLILRDRLAVRLVAQTVEPLSDEETKAKKRAALIKEIRASVLGVEDQVDALRERRARGMRP